ncbi:MAG: cupin domain-containing protein [Alphaproteobacteria bacterium]|nr:cupin domain-containing protein [Alphaproteobacteria bacterium]
MSDCNPDGLLILPTDGEASGTHLDVKIRSAQLGGDFSVMQGVMEPHQLLPPHTHVHEDQCVYVINGELEFEVGGEGGQRFTAPADAWVIKPRGVQHCFWNKTDATVHYIELSGRDGFEGFIDSTTADGSFRAAHASERDYSITFHNERIPKLMLQHRLTSIAGLDTPLEAIRKKLGMEG